MQELLSGFFSTLSCNNQDRLDTPIPCGAFMQPDATIWDVDFPSTNVDDVQTTLAVPISTNQPDCLLWEGTISTTDDVQTTLAVPISTTQLDRLL
ncbi:hypothetical protein V6N11_080392 [Hibiscus sabdariffa]|uniref:Uncharacterized protein n=1 Tax=Hibiscus sabdariffa TaxID=183260 RepID=A0ABR2R836_9ROSI